MSKIIANFSNGHSDKYNGKRDVKAAWMIILPDGRIVSGHSLDRAKAEKTARSTISHYTPEWLPSTRQLQYANYAAYWTVQAKKDGFSSLKAMIAAGKAKNAEFSAKCKIEVVDLICAEGK